MHANDWVRCALHTIHETSLLICKYMYEFKHEWESPRLKLQCISFLSFFFLFWATQGAFFLQTEFSNSAGVPSGLNNSQRPSPIVSESFMYTNWWFDIDCASIFYFLCFSPEKLLAKSMMILLTWYLSSCICTLASSLSCWTFATKSRQRSWRASCFCRHPFSSSRKRRFAWGGCEKVRTPFKYDRLPWQHIQNKLVAGGQ